MRFFFAFLTICSAALAGCSQSSGTPPPVAGNPGNARRAPHIREFAFTGGPQRFFVPRDATEVVVTADGAQGGEGGAPFTNHAQGGLGGSVTATLSVSPGESWDIIVGRHPPRGPEDRASGGGGGASELRRGTERLIVAGGGGGGGSYCVGTRSGQQGGNGGPGGGLDAGDGHNGTAGTAGGQGLGGSGGTQSGPGRGGEGGKSSGPSSAGRNGNGGQGGSGGVGNSVGGQGGEGYFGGGGGGGGGDGFMDRCGGGGGGGGSSYAARSATNVKLSRGVRTGHGKVTITW